MDRRYKVVEKMIHAWIVQRENEAAGTKEQHSFQIHEVNKPYLPLTPLHSVDLYWDSQFVSAS